MPRLTTAPRTCASCRGASTRSTCCPWYDDWALVERERNRQRRLRAMEVLSGQLVKVGRCADGVEAAMMAVRAEPLRESAQRVLIEAHVAEGNWVEGVRSFEAYRDMIAKELGATGPGPRRHGPPSRASQRRAAGRDGVAPPRGRVRRAVDVGDQWLGRFRSDLR